jgi:hypothetical protein
MGRQWNLAKNYYFWNCAFFETRVTAPVFTDYCNKRRNAKNELLLIDFTHLLLELHEEVMMDCFGN